MPSFIYFSLKLARRPTDVVQGPLNIFEFSKDPLNDPKDPLGSEGTTLGTTGIDDQRGGPYL